MPNARVLSEKQAIVEALAERIKGAEAGVFVDYRGITVAPDTQLRAELRDNGASFEDALAEIETYYGLTTEPEQEITLTETELESLRAAFELSMIPKADRELGEEEALLYGGYEPLSMAVSHIINNNAGLSYTSYAHTGLQIPVYATGVGAEAFSGLYDNTDIFFRTMEVMGLQAD